MTSVRVLSACALFLATGCGGSSIVLQSADGSTSPGDDASFDGTVDGTAGDSGVDADTSCAATCKGCCRSDGTCVTTNYPTECGSEGSACISCKAGEICNKPAEGCVPNAATPCTPENCPDGCCYWYGKAFQYCVKGTFPSQCGHGGQLCNICGAGGCTPLDGGGGSCEGQPKCSYATCNGCCINGICAVGTQDIACGHEGLACGDCTVGGGTCNANGYCK